MEDALKTIVGMACNALREEDAYLRSCLSDNPAYSDDRNGILSINNERYYQFVIARYLFKHLQRRVALESDYIDLVIYSDDGSKQYEAIVEMKRWMSSTGNPEIPGIREDFEKLLKQPAAHRIMLIFSSNPVETPIVENIEFLSKKIDRGVKPDKWVVQDFDTLGIKGKSNKFWVAGYELAPS